MSVRSCLIALTTILPLCAFAQVTVPVVVSTNVTIRVMASNLTSGSGQRYETPGINILRGLKPDIAAMQEFRYVSTNGAGTDTVNAMREMVNSSFGTNFYYFRENYTGSGDLPNGIVSRYPIISAGSWIDTVQSQPNRGFAWAQIDIPGTNDLYIVSVHLLSTAGATARATEATNLKALIQQNFPSNALVVVAGDFNSDSRTETCITTFKTFLSDTKIPTDQAGDADTNAGRTKPFDYVLPSFSLTNFQVTTAINASNFPNGLVFDSRKYTNLVDVSPVSSTDSGATGMQHMAVIKDFQFAYTLTNFVTVPKLSLIATNVIRWSGMSNTTYTVQKTSTLTNWATAASVTSTTTNFGFTNAGANTNQLFYRVTYP